MFEIRVFIQSLLAFEQDVAPFNPVQLSEYAFHDYIYHPKHTRYDLNVEFLRERVYAKTNWDQKMVELVHKVKTGDAKIGEIKLKKQFEDRSEASEFLEGYDLAFAFERTGKEYQLGELKIFLEDIQGLRPSVEIQADSEEKIDHFLSALTYYEKKTDSVPKLIEMQSLTIC